MTGGDTTRHLPVLDGLRGVAALAVVVFHVFEITGPDPSRIPFAHAYLAVDFFFCLSGYVIAHAYDGRRAAMGARRFLLVRAIRLHPLVIPGALLGLASYVFDPFTVKQVAPLWLLALATAGGMLLVPTPSLPERFDAYLPLNSPSWSLMWEYLASIAYGLVLWRLRTPVLALVALLAAAALVAVVHQVGHLSTGWSWPTIHHAAARTAFSFTAGMLLSRLGAAFATRLGFWTLAAALGLLLYLPQGPGNWLYEAAVVILAFPLIVALGAGAAVKSRTAWLCGWSGRLSYPLYALHYPFIHMLGSYTWNRGLPDASRPWIALACTGFFLLLAWAALRFYDEPLRAWLKRRFVPSRSP